MKSTRATSYGKPRFRFYTEDQNVRLDPTMLEELRESAKARGVTTAELIRTYIQWGLDTDRKEK